MMVPSTVGNLLRRQKTPNLFDVLEISRFILLPLLFPAALISWIAGSDRGEEPTGESPPPDSNPFRETEV
jgi:hypothetical protein